MLERCREEKFVREREVGLLARSLASLLAVMQRKGQVGISKAVSMLGGPGLDGIDRGRAGRARPGQAWEGWQSNRYGTGGAADQSLAGNYGARVGGAWRKG